MKISLSSFFLSAALLFFAHGHAKDKSYKGNKDCFDYIIVGFGAAGAILAKQLSDDFKTSVLVLEAGSNNMDDPATLNPNIFTDLSDLIKISFNPAFAITYPIPFPNSILAIAYSEGREWGGSAAHNYLQAVRGVPSDFNQWAVNTNSSQWLYSNILPLMKKLETYTPNGTVANPAQRGFNGPISITQNPPINANPLATAVANVTGAGFVSDYNDATLPNVSTSAIQQFVTAGSDSHRSFSANEFMTIGKVMDKKGRGLNGRKARVKGNRVVSRVLFNSSNKATGVEYIQANTVKKVYASKKVILCAGSINTPALLMLSGVGSAEDLKRLGIKTVVNSPFVGKNAQNQYGPAAIVTNSTPIPGGQIASFIDVRPYMPADDVRRMQIVGLDIGNGLAQMIGFILQPKSTGSINVVVNDPLTQPQVNVGLYNDGSYQDVGSDAYLTVSYYKIIKEVAAAAGEEVIYPTPDQYAQGDSALFNAAVSNPAILTIASHIGGTARFSTSILQGVVDANLHVFGTENLMVVDASVENPLTSGNICIGVYALAAVAAKILGVPLS